MKEIVISVINSAAQVLQQTTGLSLTRSQDDASIQGSDIHVAISLEGRVTGQLVIGMPQQTANLVSAKMLGQAEVTEFGELQRSCLAELGNMIAGNAATDLSHKGLQCTVSTPRMLTGGLPATADSGQVVSLAIGDNVPVFIQINITPIG